MASLRKPKGPFLSPDGQTAKFLYLIIKQLDLKTIDWNEVASGLEITNGHAARMRYSRFKQQVEGTTKRERAPRKRTMGVTKSTKGKSKMKSMDEDRKEKIKGEKKDDDGGLKVKDEVSDAAEFTQRQSPAVKSEPVVKQEPDCPCDEGSSVAEPLPVEIDYDASFQAMFPSQSENTSIKLEPSIQQPPQLWPPTNMPPPPRPSPMQHPVYPLQTFRHLSTQHYPQPSSPYPTVVTMADLQLRPSTATNPLYAYESVDPGLSVPRYMPLETTYRPCRPGQLGTQHQGAEVGAGTGRGGQVIKTEPTYS